MNQTQTDAIRLSITNKQRELAGAQRQSETSRSNVRDGFWQSEILRLTSEIAQLEDRLTPTAPDEPDDDPLAPLTEGEQTDADRARIAEYRAAGLHGNIFTSVSVAALALCLLTSNASASPVRYPDVPRHCHIVGTTNPADEGFPIAQCKNGRYLYSDLDGDGKHKRTNGRWLDATTYVQYGIYPTTTDKH